MKSRSIITFTCLLLTVLAINSQVTGPALSTTTTTPSYSGLRLNRIILDSNNLTYTKDNNISIFMLVENIGNLIVRNVYFNYSVDTALFAIVQSTNTTQSSNKTVYYTYKTLNPGDSFSFNMTLTVLTNKTQTDFVLPAVTIDYKYSEFLLPGSSKTNTLTINILKPKDKNTLVTKMVGNNDINTYLLAGILALPIIAGFALSIIFGRRQKRF